MDDPKPLSSSEPDPTRRPEEEADAIPLRPEGARVDGAGDEVIESGVPAPFSDEPVRGVPAYDAGTGELVGFNEPGPAIDAPPARDHLPGNAAAEEIPLADPPADEPLVVAPPGPAII